MQLDLGGHPIHTRALAVVLARAPGGGLTAAGELLDLRKRGFTPVGSALQGAGIIHQMGLDATCAGGVLQTLTARQAVVAFEASAATGGESCRDVAGGVTALAGLALDAAAAQVRPLMAGAAGCSHLLVLSQFLLATLAASDDRGDPPPADWHREVLRRDLIIDGAEGADGGLGVAVQLSELAMRPAPAAERPAARLRHHREWRLQLELEGWPATIRRARGAARTRRATDFATAPWLALDEPLAALAGVTLGRGSAQAIVAACGADAPLRDALLQLAPALIQCRASFPDKWLAAAVDTPAHDGLIGMADSCYMWRRGGALERQRAARRATP